MKLELLDAYNVRARLSASVILLAPIAITLFLCFEEIRTLASSSVIIFVLLAFTNYIPILQRHIRKGKSVPNYAAQFLYPEDKTVPVETKKRYYEKLSILDPSLSPMKKAEATEEFRSCCDNAVAVLRNKTRDHHLVQEENINYGLCKNLLASRTLGLALSIACVLMTVGITLVRFSAVRVVPSSNWLALAMNICFLLFWIFGINEGILNDAAKQYAITLLATVDSLK